MYLFQSIYSYIFKLLFLLFFFYNFSQCNQNFKYLNEICKKIDKFQMPLNCSYIFKLFKYFVFCTLPQTCYYFLNPTNSWIRSSNRFYNYISICLIMKKRKTILRLNWCIKCSKFNNILRDKLKWVNHIMEKTWPDNAENVFG